MPVLVNEPFALDLETCDPVLTTLYPAWISDSLEGHIAGICIATKDNQWYIPIGHEEGDNYDAEEELGYLKIILQSGNHPVIMHNAQYDYGWLKGRHKIKITRPIFDTMIGAPLIYEHFRSYSLDFLGKEWIGARKDEHILRQEVRSRFHKLDINERPIPLTDKDCKAYLWRLPHECVADYGKQDARLTYDLWKYELKHLKEQNLDKVMDLEMKICECLIDIRLKGIRIDVDKLQELKKKYKDKRDFHLNELTRITGVKCVLNTEEQTKYKKEKGRGTPCYSIGSVVDMSHVCDELGLEYARTEKGQPSFAEDNIPADSKWFCDHIVKAKRYGNKVLSTYLEGYIEKYIINGRIHAQFNQLRSDDGGTITGRFSSSGPNLQNIPARDPEIGPDLLSLFIADEGCKLVCLDYSAQEPRMLVHLVALLGKLYGVKAIPGADLAMSKRFQDKNSDFHMEVARAVVDKYFKPWIYGTEFTFNEKLEHMLLMSWFYIKDNEQAPSNNDELYEKAVKCYRTPAKEIGLGVMYSMGLKTLAEKLAAKGIVLELDKVKELKQAVFDAVPFLDTANKICMNAGQQRGFVKTFLGRRGRFVGFEVPEFFKEELDDGSIKWTVKKFMFRTREEASIFRAKAKIDKREMGPVSYANTHGALNKVIQGSSADQGKMGVLMCCMEGLVPSVMVHDSIVASVNNVEESKRMAEIMETCLDLCVQSKVDGATKLGRSWAEVK